MRIVLLISFVYGFQLYSQNFNIEWGKLERSPGSLLQIMPKDSNTFYSVRWSGGNNFGHYKFTLQDFLEKVREKRIKPLTEKGIGNFEVAYLCGDNIVAFISDKSGTNCELYAQEYSPELEIVSPPQLIATYVNPKIGSKPNFYVKQSDNREYLGILWEIPGRKTTSDVYGYRVLDNRLNGKQSGEYSIPFDGNLSTINEFFLTNKGDFMLSITEHLKPNDRIFTRQYDNYKSIHVYKIYENSLKEYSLNLEENRIDDMKFISDGDNFCSLTGIYAKGFRQGINGVFELRINLENDSIISSGFHEFSSSITFETFDQRNVNQPFRRMNWDRNNTLNNTQYTYLLRDLFMLEDGSQIGSVEQYHVYQRMNYDNRTGLSSSIYYYYYDDIIVFKIGSNGEMEWEKRIEKSQVSVNDNGPYSSYSSFCDGEKVVFIFNDNIRNYNEFGEFTMQDGRIYPLNLSLRRNVASITSIDVLSGDITRNKFFSRKEARALVIPKQFHLDRKSKNLMIYSIDGYRERFGLIKY